MSRGGLESATWTLRACGLWVAKRVCACVCVCVQAAVVNLDDPHAQRVLDAASSVPCITYALAADKGADVWAESVSFDIWESEVRRALRPAPAAQLPQQRF